LNTVENYGRRIGAWPMFDNIDADTLCPHLELFNGSGAKRICGNEQHFFARALILSSEFTDRCGFSNAIDAQKYDDPRPNR
jgi:hypothetical protein